MIRYVGLDLHKRLIEACFVGETGKVLERRRLEDLTERSVSTPRCWRTCCVWTISGERRHISSLGLDEFVAGLSQMRVMPRARRMPTDDTPSAEPCEEATVARVVAESVSVHAPA